MPASHKGAISFGLVYIPVGLYTATQDNDIQFNQLCKEDGSRIRYKKVCSHCGKEVTQKDIVKGFQYDKNKYVTLTDEDFEKAKTEKDRTIHIQSFTNLSEVPPIYFDKTYHVIPESGGDRAFKLLWTAMKEQKKIGIAKTVMGTKEKLLALIPTKDGMLAETLFFFDEIKEAPKEMGSARPKAEELKMAKTLIEAMEDKFNPQDYKDEYQAKLWDIINKKIGGKKIVAPKETVAVNVVDIMDALKKSLAKQKKGK